MYPSNEKEIRGDSQVLKTFQLESLSIKQKSDPAYGKALSEYIDSTVSGGTSSYFWIRNQRFKTNRNYSSGRINMSRWQDLFQFNGKENYINLLWMAINITNRIVCGLVGRWMQRSEKIQITATDTLSVNQKQKQYDQIEMIVENRALLEQLEAASGVQQIPRDTELPADKEALKLWQHQFQRLPEEILYQLGCNEVLAANGFFDVNKEKLLHDSAEVGLLGTYTWMDDDGVIHVEWVKPEDAFYSYSNYPDFRDTKWRGRRTTYKISDIRLKYSQEFGGKLTEEQLWEIAQSAKEFQLYDNLTWLTEWNVSFLRPYDEWNVDILEFELKTVDSEPYTVTTTKKNKSTIIQKGKPKKKEENQEVVEDTKVNIYRGVYARTTKIMLEWGLKKNMIRPEDPKELGNAEFSYSFYMPQNYDMTSLAIPEKIQEPVDQMIGVCLRMQQLIAKMRPTGAMINWDALQNIDYGLGDGNKTVDVQKLYDQTGTLYYRGKDAEGNNVPVPITELANAGFLPQMQGLIELYRFHYQVLKDELGEDPNLITQAAQPRVAVSNIDTAQQQAVFATDYMYSGYVRIMEDTAKKISCLLKKSVVYGSEAYRKLVSEEDIGNRIFTTRINLLPDQIQIAKFEQLLNQTMATSPDIVMFVDPFQLMRMAKEDVDLAEALFRQGQRKMLNHQISMTRENQDATFKAQVESARTGEEEKRKTKQLEIDGDIKKSEVVALANNKTAVLNMVSGWLKPSADGAIGKVAPAYQPLVNSVIDNVMIAAIAETEEQKLKITQQIEAARQQELMAEQNQQPQQPVAA